jgi:hypothetical protein
VVSFLAETHPVAGSFKKAGGGPFLLVDMAVLMASRCAARLRGYIGILATKVGFQFVEVFLETSSYDAKQSLSKPPCPRLNWKEDFYIIIYCDVWRFLQELNRT